jgi:hypothetical protein
MEGKKAEMNVKSAEMKMSERAVNSMKDVAIEFAESCVRECARMYKFDGDEAVMLLGLRSPVVLTKRTKEKRVIAKPKFIFPYSGGSNELVCQGLVLNGGLFTQCEMAKKTQLYCGKCSNQADKNAHGTPNYGTIMDRNSVGIMDYIDPSGKRPVSYMKFITKKKWNLTEVQEEAKKYSITINEIHFVEETTSKRRGRKPRVRSQVAYDTDDESSQDMFDTINDKEPNDADDDKSPQMSNDDDDVGDICTQFSKMDVMPATVVVEPLVAQAPQEMPIPVLQDTEKADPVPELAPAEEEDACQNEPMRPASQDAVSPKSVKKSEKSEKQKQKEIEKQAKLDEKKAAAAVKEMEKKKKEEDAIAKKAKSDTSNSKISKPSVSKQVSNSNDKSPSSNTKADMFCKKGKEPIMAVAPQTKPTPAPKKPDTASVSVKPFTHNGVKYYKSTDNILYDKSGNPQGEWNETTKTITPIIEDEEDEEAEDAESEAEENSEEEEEDYEEEEPQGSARYASKTSELLDEIEYYECLESN